MEREELEREIVEAERHVQRLTNAKACLSQAAQDCAPYSPQLGERVKALEDLVDEYLATATVSVNELMKLAPYMRGK